MDGREEGEGEMRNKLGKVIKVRGRGQRQMQKRKGSRELIIWSKKYLSL